MFLQAIVSRVALPCIPFDYRRSGDGIAFTRLDAVANANNEIQSYSVASVLLYRYIVTTSGDWRRRKARVTRCPVTCDGPASSL